MKKIALFAGLILALSGCAGMADVGSKLAGIGTITENKSSFDNSTIISMSPNFLYDENAGWTGVPVKLGARWTSASPDYVALVLAYSSSTAGGGSGLYTNFTGLDINIDGKIESYKVSGMTRHQSSGYNTVSQQIYTESANTVVIPWSTLKAMMAAKDCRLRVHTQDGYVDAQFSVERIPGGQGTAKITMAEFVTKVESLKSSK